MSLDASLQIFGGSVSGAKNSRWSWGHRQGIVLRLADADGQVGLGEASPLPGYSPDDLDDCSRALATFDWSEVDVDTRRFAGGSLPPAARHAIDSALTDLAARRAGLPAWRLWSARVPACVECCGLVTSDRPEAWEAAARDVLASGASAVKLKVGRPGSFESELRGVRAVRRVVGDIPLRLDANGALDLDEARRWLTALEDVDIELFEEPVSFPALFDLDATDVPLAIDETLQQDLSDADWARARAAGVRAVVLKPMVLGGLASCLEIARKAEAHQFDVIVSHLFDGPLALAAASTLALIVKSPRAHGLAPHAGLAAWPRVELPMSVDGELRAWEAPGLGISGLP